MTRDKRSKRQLSKSFMVVIRPSSTRLIAQNFRVSLSYRRSTTVSLETRILTRVLTLLLTQAGMHDNPLNGAHSKLKDLVTCLKNRSPSTYPLAPRHRIESRAYSVTLPSRKSRWFLLYLGTIWNLDYMSRQISANPTKAWRTQCLSLVFNYASHTRHLTRSVVALEIAK